MEKELKIDGHSFNREWAKTKSADEFLKEFKDMEHIFPDTKDKVGKLKEAHALLIKEDAPEVKAPVVVTPAIK